MTSGSLDRFVGSIAERGGWNPWKYWLFVFKKGFAIFQKYMLYRNGFKKKFFMYFFFFFTVCHRAIFLTRSRGAIIIIIIIILYKYIYINTYRVLKSLRVFLRVSSTILFFSWSYVFFLFPSRVLSYFFA